MESENTDESELDVDFDEERELGAESCNMLQTSAPIVDLPISREGLEPEDFTIPSREEFVTEQKADAELKQLRQWLEVNQCPSADELAALSGRMKALAQLFEQISIQDGLLVIKREDDPERELTLVPSAKVEHIIRFYHEGPGGAHQAAKATSAKVIRCFWWPDLKRDVRLYIACCPVCEKFLKIKRTPRAGLRSMDVGGRGDCIAMDIVGGMDSFPLTPRGNRYILTIIDCFTRYAVAVPLVDQSAEVVIAAVLNHYITVYGTPRRILTDQGRNFESDQFAKFCVLFRIAKIRTTAYRPQSNGICERFNQTLKNSLVKILSKAQQASWDIYLSFAVFSYNLSIHSSTGFTPYFLTFGSEARLPPDIIFGTPTSATSSNLDARALQDGSVSFLFKSFSLLSGIFTLVRENLNTFHQREKDRYDLGAIERVFRAGDRVRVRIKSRQKGHSKFLSEWSEPHEVLEVRGVVVTVRELSTGREYRTHHDRLSNPLFSGQKLVEVDPHEQNANPIENPEEPEDVPELGGAPEEPRTQTRSGRVSKSRRDPQFDYNFVLPEFKVIRTSTSSNTCSCTSVFTQTSAKTCSSVRTSASCNAFSNSVSRSLLCITNASASFISRPHANPESMSRSQEDVIREKRQHAVNLGERPSWVQDADKPQQLVFMLKRNGTLFTLDLQRKDWVTFLDRATLDEVLEEERWNEPTEQRALRDEEVALPKFFKDFPGGEDAYKWPNYGLQKPWQDYVAARAKRMKITLPPLRPVPNLSELTAANPGVTAVVTSLSESSSGANLKVAVTSNVWTSALRMTTAEQGSRTEESALCVPVPQTGSTMIPVNVTSTGVAAASTTLSFSISNLIQPRLPSVLVSTSAPTVSVPTSTLQAGAEPRPPTPMQPDLSSTAMRGPSYSSGRYTAESSESPAIHSWSESAPGSVKHGLSSPFETEPMDEDIRAAVPTEDEVQRMLNEPLRVILEQFTQHPGDDIALLNLRPLTAIFERLGYTLEERLPPVENLNQRDLSVFGYLQIADQLPSTNVIALNLDEFNQLVSDVVREQYGVYARSFRPRHISLQRLQELARIVVRDPTGVLRGGPEVEPQKASTSTYSAGPTSSATT